MNPSTHTLREALKNYRTRSQAIESAVTEGTGIVESAILLLNDREEGVRWSAIRILAHIGDPRAVTPLLKLMEGDHHGHDAAEALRCITGKTLGEDPAAWREALGIAEAPPRSPAAAAANVADPTDEDLLLMALEGTGAQVEGEHGQYTVDLPVTPQRRQRVWVNMAHPGIDKTLLIQLSTVCGPDDPGKYEWALKTNVGLPFGAIGIARIGEERCLAITHNIVRARCHPQELGQALLSLAREGDRAEALFSEQDQH